MAASKPMSRSQGPDAPSLARLFRLLERLHPVECIFITLLEPLDGRRFYSNDRCGKLRDASRDVANAILKSAAPLILQANGPSAAANRQAVDPGALGLEFLAGVALRDATGKAIGTLCLASRTPVSASEIDRQALEDAAHLAVREIQHDGAEQTARDAWKVMVEAIETLPDGFVLFDKHDRLTICNEQYRETYPESAHVIQPGRSFEEIIREGVRCKQYAEAIGREDAWIAERLAAHANPTGPVEQLLPDGRWVRVLEKRLPNGGTVGFRVDITELKMRQAELYELAHRDELTGTMSRRAILSAARDCGIRARARGEPLCLMILDIDKFKKVNDDLGHFAGDEVLKEFCRRIESQLRDTDYLGRLGGEEFLVILPNTSSSESVERAERMRTLLSATPIPLEDKDIALTMSLGVTDYRDDDTMDEAFARADRLLYRSKDMGRDRTTAEFLDAPSRPAGR
ncbi:diguanylate cyclase [Stappia stellulata]|uniref:sensor domain-containing diguanylate cyclase n=1 Tax=Stappia stellulata TaxID=71235 RepID=UPI001CD4F783|nr:sensor domain-containing diguanylate cyclase [Stappia stellulata]MCA1243350.1 diguanylate cyclase [Stappia stellulata]